MVMSDIAIPSLRILLENVSLCALHLFLLLVIVLGLECCILFLASWHIIDTLISGAQRYNYIHSMLEVGGRRQCPTTVILVCSKLVLAYRNPV